jgi:hypothetical protein
MTTAGNVTAPLHRPSLSAEIGTALLDGCFSYGTAFAVLGVVRIHKAVVEADPHPGTAALVVASVVGIAAFTVRNRRVAHATTSVGRRVFHVVSRFLVALCAPPTALLVLATGAPHMLRIFPYAAAAAGVTGGAMLLLRFSWSRARGPGVAS